MAGYTSLRLGLRLHTEPCAALSRLPSRVPSARRSGLFVPALASVGSALPRVHGLKTTTGRPSSAGSAPAASVATSIPSATTGGAVPLDTQATTIDKGHDPRECVLQFLSSEADAGIAVLTLNRPAAMNALGVRLLSQLSTCLAQLETEPDLARVLIVRSAVAGVFCAGADLKERAAMKPQEVRAFVNALRATFTRLEHLPMPTIAAIDGAALGGGLELALAADLRVVGGAKARLGVPETRLAIIPGAGGTQRLTRVVGLAKAKELAFTATPVGPDEAVRIGLANRAASEGRSAYDEALHLAQAMLPAGPIAMRMAKVAIHQGSQMDQASGMILEQQCYAQVIQTEDRLEGLNAFREKRKPVFHGR